jgi:hypothetical protein
MLVYEFFCVLQCFSAFPASKACTLRFYAWLVKCGPRCTASALAIIAGLCGAMFVWLCFTVVTVLIFTSEGSDFPYTGPYVEAWLTGGDRSDAAGFVYAYIVGIIVMYFVVMSGILAVLGAARAVTLLRTWTRLGWWTVALSFTLLFGALMLGVYAAAMISDYD